MNKQDAQDVVNLLGAATWLILFIIHPLGGLGVLALWLVMLRMGS